MKFSQTELPSNLRWWVVLVIAICVAMTGLVINETLLRIAGHPSTVVSDADLWALERTRVDHIERHGIVLVGASRMQTNVDTAVLRQQCKSLPIVQLAMSGRGSPLPVVENIVLQSDFQGLLVVSETEATLLNRASSQDSYVNVFEQGFRLEAQINRKLRNIVEKNLRSVTPYGSSTRLYGSILTKRHLPYSFHVTTYPDRSQSTNFELMDPAILKEVRSRAEESVKLNRDEVVENEATWRRRVRDAYEPLITAFEQRGGQVVFVRMPVDELRWSQEESTWPLESYWSQLSDVLGVGAVHFTELRDWRGFELGDRSHLSGDEKDRFTRMLFRKVPDALGKKNTAYNCLSGL